MEENNIVETTTTVEKEGSKFGWGVLGFFFPIVGLILFLVWKNNKKKASKASGIGALVGFILGLISTILFFTLGIGTLIGIGSILESNENSIANSTETNKVETNTDKKNETTTYEGETASSNDACVVTATLGEEDVYNYSLNESCEETKIVDENNKVLFKAKNDKIITNNGEELDYPVKSFYKLNNSIVLYSMWCSPGYCYVYVYNTNDNTGFKIDNSIEKEVIVPYISSIDHDKDKNLYVRFEINNSASMESIYDEPKVKVYTQTKSCSIDDINSALNAYGLDDFSLKNYYLYKNENGNLKNDPEITSGLRIKQFYAEHSMNCNN